MTDIAERLRRWAIATDAVPASDLMDEAADEIERLREAIRRLADQDATLSVCDGSVTVTVDEPPSDESYGVWHDRSEQPPIDRPVLLYTRQLEGYMWVGRRGLLPNDVTHWCHLPEPPNAKK